MIEARGLVKRYGPTTAVDNLSFDVRPGTVTGFLGPNGARWAPRSRTRSASSCRC
jgi:ABC-2 type transport system ATP-binding protein